MSVFYQKRQNMLTETTSYDNRLTLIKFSGVKAIGENRMGSPPVGAPNTDGLGFSRRFLTSVSLYHRNGARQGHS